MSAAPGPLGAAGRRIRVARWVALLLLAASLAMIAFSLLSLVLPGTELLPFRPPLGSFLAFVCVFATFPSVGAVVAIRRPGNPIGWLLLVIGICLTLSVASTEYVGRALYTGLALPAVALVDWAGTWTFLLAAGLLFVWIPLLFPTGGLLGPRWRWFARAAAVAMAVGVTATAVIPGPLPGDNGVVPNPLGAPTAFTDLIAILVALAFPAIAICGLVAIASLGLRYRRAESIERAQIKWLLLATSVLIATLVVASITQIEVAFYAALVAAAAVPAATGIAILRYRLWDIDRLISRTIAYTIVTGVLALTFVVTILGLQAALASFTRDQTIVVAASTLVAAALFQPLRGRVQRAVDLRFDRARVDGERTSAAFADRIRDKVEIHAVATELAATVDRSIRPASQGLWLRGAAE